jgi:branched-chain amino acid transport system permease protein
MSTRRRSLETATLTAVAVFLVVLPLFGSDFFVEFVMTRTMMLGIAAASVVFLSAYGGMVSLAQLLMFGISGFMIGNFVAETGSKGLKLGWNPWVSIVVALLITSLVALVTGALSSRTTGIYYLMLTFTYAVIGVLFFRSVVELSGSSGLTGIDPPAMFDDHPVREYYLGLGISVAVYLGFRVLRRTPFGMVLQGIRDDPIRMASLGFNVPLHRTLAFVMAGFVAGVAGVLNVWWNGQIGPQSIDVGPTIDLLIIAVIGGINRLEGAWLGAFVFVAANNYLRDLPFADTFNKVLQHIPGEWTITESTFHTWIGVMVLAIVVHSPDGLMGIIGRLQGAGRRLRTRDTSVPNQIDDGADSPSTKGS